MQSFRFISTASILLATLFSLTQIACADIIDIVSGSNTATIAQVVVNVVDLDNNSFVSTQNAPINTGAILAKTAFLDSITLSDSTVLSNFSFLTPTIINADFPNSGAIEVFSNGSAIGVNDTGFLSALGSVHSNGDLASYIRVDGSSGNSAWDLDYSQAIDTSGYFIVEERNGNTNFSLTALDVNGDVIGDTLRFDAPSYQWDTSIKHYLDPNNNDQTQELSVIDLSLFNTSADVYGFRVVNTGNADFKFSFASTTAVPEPVSLFLPMAAILAISMRRKRRIG